MSKPMILDLVEGGYAIRDAFESALDVFLLFGSRAHLRDRWRAGQLPDHIARNAQKEVAWLLAQVESGALPDPHSGLDPYAGTMMGLSPGKGWRFMARDLRGWPEERYASYEEARAAVKGRKGAGLGQGEEEGIWS